MVTFPCFVRLTATKVPEEPGFIEFVGQCSDDGIDWKLVSAMTKIAIDGQADGRPGRDGPTWEGRRYHHRSGSRVLLQGRRGPGGFQRHLVAPHVVRHPADDARSSDHAGIEIVGPSGPALPAPSCEDLIMIAVIFLGLALGLDSFRASLAMARIGAGRGAGDSDCARLRRLRWSCSVGRPGIEPGDGRLCRVVVGIDRPGGAHRLRGIRTLEAVGGRTAVSPKEDGQFSGCRSS